MSHTILIAFIVFPKKKGEVAFHGNVGARFFILPGFLFSLIISVKGFNETVIKVLPFILFFLLCLISFWACPSPTSLFTTSETVAYCLSFMSSFPRLAGIWMLGIHIGSVLEGMLPAATTCWRVIVLEIGIPKLLPYSWIPEGLKVPDFDFSVFFFFAALVSACRILLQSPELLPIVSFSYSATTAQPLSLESTILINLFLFFSL